MFLTNPTISELQLLDLPVLVDMLAKQTTDYVQLISEEGFTARTTAAKESIQNIQAAIEAKRTAGKFPIDTIPVANPPFDNNIQGIQKIS